ncbi:MAG: dephospho-CoA kinase, partial [Planctomycetota bacterium]
MNFSSGRNNNGGNNRNPNFRRRRRRFRRGDRPPQQNTVLDEIELSVPEDKTVVIGVTGEPGSGKSTFAKCFAKLGAELIDVDALGHEVLEQPATRKKLVESFGEDIQAEDGSIQRDVLAERAFADPEGVATLNKITHGQLGRKVKLQLKKAGNFVVIDAALLNELGLGELCSTTVYVRTDRQQRMERVQRRGWDEAELQRREQALGDAEERAQACALIVENTGDSSLLDTYAKTILARQLGIDPIAQYKAANNMPGGGDDAGEEDEDQGEQGEPIGAGGATGVDLPTQTLTPEVRKELQPPEPEPVTLNLEDYLRRDLVDLQEEGERMNLRDVRYLNKQELITEILRKAASGRQDSIIVTGFVELHKDHNGYLRSPLNSYHASATDTFINNQLLRRYGLKPGMLVTGKARAPRGNERCPQMLSITEVMGEPVENRRKWPRFEDLVPLHAEERLFMERSDKPMDFNLRIIDLVAPIGKGQRGLIVSQPKAGKTVYLQKIANAITTNNPEVKLM